MAEDKRKNKMQDTDAASIREAKLASLKTVLEKMDKAYGKGSVMIMGQHEVEKVEVIPTGSLGLDLALGVGGYPRGRIVVSKLDLPTAWRVHGGGFAGTVQAYVPAKDAEGFVTLLESVFGKGSCYLLHVRPSGAVKVF